MKQSMQLWRSVRSLQLKQAWLALASVSVFVSVVGALAIQLHQTHAARQETLLSMDATSLALDVETEAILDGLPASVQVDQTGFITFNGDDTDLGWASLDDDTKLEYYTKQGEAYTFCLTHDSGLWALYDSRLEEVQTGRDGSCQNAIQAR